jgi:uncharacterized protein involved in exopolysaccharide biosynthesis
MSKTPDWLAALETRVQEAADALGSLREQNATLQEQVTDLEGQLGAAGDEGAAAWSAERDEIRQRVEALVDKLAALVEP